MHPCGSAEPMIERMAARHPATDDRSAMLRERFFEVPWEVARAAWQGRVAAWLVMLFWGTSVLLGRMTETPDVLHLTVILFHEAGHVFFSPFGEALHVAGGTLGQVAMPFVCAVALHRRGDNFGASIACVWMAMSLMDASVYAYDAFDPLLPLIGGGTGADSFHDFVFLFDRYGQLPHARGWAIAMKALAGLGFCTAIAWGACLLIMQRANLER